MKIRGDDTSILVDGQACSLIDVRDRGLQYGDGLFETIAVVGCNPCLWDAHMRRLSSSCSRLRLARPDSRQLLQEVHTVVDARSTGVVKIILSRGIGGRGYRIPVSPAPSRIIQYYPLGTEQPAGREITARVCATPLSINPALAGMKSLNCLEQVLARSEWRDPAVEEGFMLDPDGDLVEGTMSNLFLVKAGQIITPTLDRCGVAGVMRGLVMDLAGALGISLVERCVPLSELWTAEALFVTNSIIGLCPVTSVSGHAFETKAIDHRLVEQVMERGFRM